MKYEATCPHCSKTLFIPEENLYTSCVCPHCNEEICFTRDDAEAESRRKSKFKFVIAKFDDVERIVNTLYKEEGWYVVSQSTVFLSETSGGIGGFGAGTREEGLALIFRKDD